MPGNTCYHCGETVLNGSYEHIPIVSEPDPVIEKVHLPGQLHPIGSNPNTWTPRAVGGRLEKEEEILHLLKQLGYDEELKPKQLSKKN